MRLIMFRFLLLVAVGTSGLFGSTGAMAHADQVPSNVILFIGDGMGFEHVAAANLFAGRRLSFERFPHQTEMTTASANSPITDSAAGGTAIATGVKVDNGVVSQAIPGDESDLPTLLEYFRSVSKATGLVTNAQLTDATPAAFGAHAARRSDQAAIAEDYFTSSRPNVLFGADGSGISAAGAEAAGYAVVTNVDEMKAIAAEAHSIDSHVYGGFGNYTSFGVDFLNQGTLALEADELFATLVGSARPYADLGTPHLSEMTIAALDILGQSDDGFFLMIESANIDKQAHYADINRVLVPADAPLLSPEGIIIQEVLQLSDAVAAAIKWVHKQRLSGSTLIVVTADHETAGILVTGDNGRGNIPSVEYTAGFFDFTPFGLPAVRYDHTAANVPVYATGRNAVLFSDNPIYGKAVMDNTELHDRFISRKSIFRAPCHDREVAP